MHPLLPVPSDSMMPEAGLPLTLRREHLLPRSPRQAQALLNSVQRCKELSPCRVCWDPKQHHLNLCVSQRPSPKQALSSVCSPFSTKFLFICFSYSSPLSFCLPHHRPLPSYIHQLTQITANGLPAPPHHKKHWNMWIIWVLGQSKLKRAQTFTRCVQFTCLSHQLSHSVFTVILWGSDIIPLL